MKEKVYITGHINPDTDSVCAAIAYAYLKERLSPIQAIPLRLGELNQETKFVLDYFGVEAPEFMESMKPQVKDLEMDNAYCVSENISLKKALNLLQDNHLNSLPVIDDHEDLIGIISLSNITQSYMDIWDDYILGRSNTKIENIVEVLSAKYVVIPEHPREMSGRMSVFALRPNKKADLVEEGDIVILGDREDAQEACIEQNCSVMILTGAAELNEKLQKKAKKQNITVLTTHLNTFMAARLLPQSVPVSHIMTKDDLITFRLDDTVDEVQQIMAKTRYRSYPVLDYQNRVIGNISRYHLISYEKKKLILVDHNEKNQSIDDIEEAEILEIIDHHRVANVFTEGPIYFRNEPVGSTSTIVSQMFFENGVRPPKAIAGILCAAIISDTLLFRSPTSTIIDERILEQMSKIACIDTEKFAMEMFRKGTSLENKKPIDLLRSDVKRFIIQEEGLRVCQVFTVDMESLTPIREELLSLMDNLRRENMETTFVLMITDIFKEESEVLVSGKYGEELAQSFNEKLKDQSFMAKGLLSRKKQLIPKLSYIVETH